MLPKCYSNNIVQIIKMLTHNKKQQKQKKEKERKNKNNHLFNYSS